VIDSFWRSTAGPEISWRRWEMRTRYLRSEGEPEQKTRRGSRYRAAATQRDLADQLGSLISIRWRGQSRSMSISRQSTATAQCA
jgi:hypothetical protein